MKIYLALDDVKAGPFTIFQVEEKLRSKEVSETTLGWHEGIEKWAPLRELAPFESFFRLRDADEEDERRRKQAERMAKEEESAAPDVTGVQILVRGVARFTDFCLCFFFALGLTALLRQFGWVQLTYFEFMQRTFVLLLIPWHLLEGWMVAQWGCTPGKALCGIRVADRDGERLGFRASLRRSLGVFVIGMGCYISFLPIITGILAMMRIQKKGFAFWDTTAESQVVQGAVKARYFLLPIALMFLLGNLLHQPIEDLNEEVQAFLEKTRAGQQ